MAALIEESTITAELPPCSRVPAVNLAVVGFVLVHTEPRYCRKILRQPGPCESQNPILTVAKTLCPVRGREAFTLRNQKFWKFLFSFEVSLTVILWEGGVTHLSLIVTPVRNSASSELLSM